VAETDEEQLEAIKRWWDENGTSILVGAVLAVGGVLGYQAWQNHVQTKGETAAAIYDDMVDQVRLESPLQSRDEESISTVQFLASRLKEEHGGSTYAHFAALFLAQLAVEAGDLQKAEAELSWVIEDGIDDSIAPIARIRLARVQSGLGNHDEALATLGGFEPGEHLPSWAETKGDIHYARNEKDEARAAYQRGLDALENPASRPMLRMKFEDLEAPEVVLPVEPSEPLASTEESTSPEDE